MQKRLLRLPDVKARTGLSRATIYRLIGIGEFPAQVKISERAVGWDEEKIQEYIADRLAV